MFQSFLKLNSTTKIISLVVFFSLIFIGNAQNDSAQKDARLLEDYIKSKGYTHPIEFTPSNIKQFWTDNTVFSKDDSINILLNNKENDQFASNLFKIQLLNVIETQDCIVDVITETKNVSFSVYNSKGKVISTPKVEYDFIQYHVVSSLFHLEDTDDFSFSLSFLSPQEIIKIKRIVVSFSQNNNSVYSGSPGFDRLSDKIENEGKLHAQSGVRYLYLEDLHKMFVKVPSTIPLDSYFILHIVPADSSDFMPERQQYGFNNYDFIITNKPKSVIPKPYSSKSQDSIYQVILPSYKYRSLDFGQYKMIDGERVNYWRTQIYYKQSD